MEEGRRTRKPSARAVEAAAGRDMPLRGRGRGRGAAAAAGSAPRPRSRAPRVPQPCHMTPCACHCAACRAAGHGSACVVLRTGLLRLFHGKADIVDLVLRHYYGACGWGTARLDAAIECVQYRPAGDVIAAGDRHGRIHFICAQTGEKILCPRGEKAIHSLAFSPDGQLMATGDGDILGGTVRIYCASTGEVQRALRGHDSTVMSVSWSPDGTRLASGSLDKTVRLWDASTGAPIGSPLRGHRYAPSLSKECFLSFG